MQGMNRNMQHVSKEFEGQTYLLKYRTSPNYCYNRTAKALRHLQEKGEVLSGLNRHISEE